MSRNFGARQALPLWFIRLFTLEGDLVLDPFAGSGTTAVACEQLNRKYVMVDVIEEYKREAEQRLSCDEAFTADIQLELSVGGTSWGADGPC